jgi:hypothetical protein
MDDSILQSNSSTLLINNALIANVDNTVPDINLSPKIVSLVNRFDPISLSEMDSVKLMNRVDTKFTTGTDELIVLLEKATEHYRKVEIDGERVAPYSSVYFDTGNTIMYHTHHDGKLNRYKIRMRSYLNSELSFLEIKRKNNKGRTSKKRMSISFDNFNSLSVGENEQQFVEEKTPYFATDLKPQLQSSFKRITLVDKNLTERVTLDIDLNYKNISTHDTKNMNGLVIIEMKQDGMNRSYFRQYLNDLRIKPGSISKYCLGMVLVNPDIKSNRFKKKIRNITKITKKYYDSI